MKLFHRRKQEGPGARKLRETALRQIKQTMEGWREPDIYAVSIWMEDRGDNPCEPAFVLGYNTEAQYQRTISEAGSPLEARWNFAFWLQHEGLVFGEGETKPLVEDWIRELGFTCYTCDEMFGDPEPEESTYAGITEAFVRFLVGIVQELHRSGFVEQCFGRKIPILIHELEYDHQIAAQNREANDMPLEDFARFCAGES